jgi:CubicO group peptidase (beta-lactamase class C family)
MISRRPLLLGAVASGLLASPAWAQRAGEFAGNWHGVLNVGQTRLRLRFEIADGPSATLYSLDQGNAAIPAASTQIAGARIDLSFPNIAARYQGELSNGRIEGVFTQGEATMMLSLGREPITVPAPPSVEALTQARLAELRANVGAPAMAAAAAKRDGRSIAFADGLRAVGQTAAVTTSDRWHLGSITKSMTATLVARTAEAGAISWDDTVGDVLGAAAPEMRAEYRNITYRHLLSHRSGLPANIETAQLLAFPRYNDDSRQDRVAYARLALAQAPLGPADQTFTYSNSGYVIAGAMLEARMGATWESLIQSHVFAPLGMASAGQGAPGSPGVYDEPVGHNAGVSGLMPFPPGGEITDNPAVLGPAGRVHAAFEDVLKYLAAHRDRTPFLRSESWERLHTPPFGGDYAMGWVQRDGGLWHNGSNTLWYAEVSFNPGAGVVAAAATNDGRIGIVGPTLGAVLRSAALAVA